jgi:glycosyltransferase involved in cell wall biosynthesis
MRTIWIFSVFSAPPEYEMRYRTSKMAQELAQDGNRVIIFASSAIHNTDTNLIEGKAPYITRRYNGIDYIFVRCSSYHTNGPDRIASLIEFYFRLGGVLREFDEPDLIIAESPYPTVAHSGILQARKHGVPCIVEIRDLWPESLVVYQGYSRYNPLIIGLYWLEKWIYKNANALVFSMPGGWDYVKHRGWERAIRKSKVFYVNNGVDLKEFFEERNEFVLPDDDLDNPSTFNVVYSGSIRYVNNLGPVIEAAHLLRQQGENCRLLLYGDGNERPVLEEFCEKENIDNVVFKGFVEKKYIPSIVSRADANLVSVRETRLGRFGNSWNKLFEYLAAGKPVISNFHNAYDVIEENDCGVISDDQSSASIASAIQKVMRLSDLQRAQMGERALAAIRQFDYPYLASKLKGIISGLFGSDAPVGLVSLCTIAYNEDEVIEDLFATMVAQDYPHEKIEIVLVDGLSTDRTKALMEKFSQEDNGFCRVRVVDNPQRVQPSGWNVAIKSSTGDAIIRVDAHAYIPPDFVRNSVATLEGGEDVCGGVRPVRLYHETPWAQTLLIAEQSVFGSSIANYRRNIRPGYVSSIFHGSYRREVFKKAGLFDERLIRTEDNEIHYRIRKAGYRIKLNPEIYSYQYARSTFRGMTQQKEKNGYWIGRTLFISPLCLRIHHLVPALALLGVFILFVFGLTLSWMPLLLFVGLYAVMNIVISLTSALRTAKHSKVMLALPIIFVFMHVSYGLGTFRGLFRGLFDFLFFQNRKSGAGTSPTGG